MTTMYGCGRVLGLMLICLGQLEASAAPVDIPSSKPPPTKWDGNGAVVVLIPGTYSDHTGAGWASPGDPTFEALRRHTRADIRTFTWSGGNDALARETAAVEFSKWLRDQKLDPSTPLYVIGHSHGGNVAMLAMKSGVRVEGLTLLCTPIHDEYLPIRRTRLGSQMIDNAGFVHNVFTEGDLVQRNANTPFPGNVDMTRAGRSKSQIPSVANGENIDYEKLEREVLERLSAEPTSSRARSWGGGRGGVEKHVDCHAPEVLELLIEARALPHMPLYPFEDPILDRPGQAGKRDASQALPRHPDVQPLPGKDTNEDPCAAMREEARQRIGKRPASNLGETQALLQKKLELFGRLTRAKSEEEKRALKAEMDAITKKMEGSDRRSQLTAEQIETLPCDDLKKKLDGGNQR